MIDSGVANTSTRTRCSGCGHAPLSSESGLCPACLLRLALGESPPPEAADSHPPPMMDWLRVKGTRIGNYELLDEVARGGMGIVYRARQLQPARVVALKMMLPYLAASEPMRRRFRVETDAVAHLDHPGILPIYEVAEQDGLPYFSMKFADGGSLAKRLATLTGQWREIALTISKVADAIQHAHERGILHRDLKPGNILFDSRGEPMVADFGLAKFRAVDQNLTMPTSVLGTPTYMAPEQITSNLGVIGPATDIYSLGAILYELLCGRPPILAEDPSATLRLIATAVPEPASRLDPRIPRALDAITLKCLEKRPERRYPSAAALARDLGRWLAGRSVRAAAPQRHHLRWAAAGAVSLLAAAAALALALHGGHARVKAMTSTGPQSIAVLKFIDDSKIPDQGYLADGLSTELIDALARSPVLRVSPRDASFRFKPTGQPFARAAEALGVTYVLAGHTERRGEQLLVRAELLRGPKGARIWSAAYQRPVGELLGVRNMIAGDVCAALSIANSPGEAELAAPTRNPEAYRLYVAMYTLYENSWGSADVRVHIIETLRKVTELEPTFAKAWALLSLVLVTQTAYDTTEKGWDPVMGYAEARDAAERAIRLDPGVGDGYRALAKVLQIHDRDWLAAREAIGKALVLQPNDPWTLRVAMLAEYQLGQFDAAIRYAQAAVASDPFDTTARLNLCEAYSIAGRYDEAISECRRLLRLDPGFTVAHVSIASINLLQGRSEAALDEIEHLYKSDGMVRAEVYEAQGRMAESDALLAELKRQFALGQVWSATEIAVVYAYRGDATRAMEWLEIAEIRGDWSIQGAWGAFYRPIANDPRYLAFLKRTNLLPPSEWADSPSRIADTATSPTK